MTTNGYCQRVKTIIQFGIDNGHIKINPFSGINPTKEAILAVLSEIEEERPDISFMFEEFVVVDD